MENQNTPSENPVVAKVVEPATVIVPPVSGEEVAESYVRNELRQAQNSLRTTQAASVIILVLTVGYMGYMTWRVQQFAKPEAAAEIANGLVAERVDTYSQGAADAFKTQIPLFMSSLPDQAIAAAPQLRQSLVSQVEDQLDKYAKQHSAAMGENIDEFLEKNKTQVGALLKDGQNKELVADMGPELEGQMLQFLQEKPKEGGESAQQQIDKSLQVLLDMKKRTDHLAANKNLTKEEQNARLAIAVIGKTIKRETKGTNAGQLLKDATSNINNKIGSLGSPDISKDDGLDAKAPDANAPQSAPTNKAPTNVAPPASPR